MPSSATNSNAEQLQGVPIEATAPTDGQLMEYNSARGSWAPTTPGAGGLVPSTRTLTAGLGLTGGGDLSANRTFAVDTTSAPIRDIPKRDVAIASFTVAVGDLGSILFCSFAGAIAGALPDLSAGVNVGSAQAFQVEQTDPAGVVTMTPGTGVTVNGSNSPLTFSTGRGAVLFVSENGKDWQTSGSAIPDGSITTSMLAAGAVTAAKIAALTITDAQVAAANKDGAAGTASMRTIGTGAAQAAAGTTLATAQAYADAAVAAAVAALRTMMKFAGGITGVVSGTVAGYLADDPGATSSTTSLGYPVGARTAKRLLVDVDANALTSACTVTVRKNDVDTALTVSYTAGQTGVKTSSGSVAFADGDEVDVLVSNTNGTIAVFRATAVIEWTA